LKGTQTWVPWHCQVATQFGQTMCWIKPTRTKTCKQTRTVLANWNLKRVNPDMFFAKQKYVVAGKEEEVLWKL